MTFSLHQEWVVMSSQITHTHTVANLHPLANILDICTLIFCNCAFFTVYRNPLQVITTRTREGGSKEHRAKKKRPRKIHSVIYVPGLSILLMLINTFPEITTSTTIYADDVQLLFSGTPNNLEQLKINAETSLNTMKEWYSENGLKMT